MDLPGPSSTPAGSKLLKKRGSERTLTEIAGQFVYRDGPKAKCAIDPDSKCEYEQSTYDPGNAIRHFRAKHPAQAIKAGLLNDDGTAVKKPRIVKKIPIAIDKQLFIDSTIKKITKHNLSLASLEWEAFKQIDDPIAAALGITINRQNVKSLLHSASKEIRAVLAEEMKGRLISLKIDSASKHHRHVLGINAQYVLRDKIVIRTLGKLMYT